PVPAASGEMACAGRLCGSARGRMLLAAMAVGVVTASVPLPALAHGPAAAEPVLPGVLLAWRFEPLVLIPVALAAAAWLWLARIVARRHAAHPPEAWRIGAFLCGLGVIAIALTSPIEAYEGQLFSVHMLQHMLLELVAAPLLLLGAPATLALRAASPSVRHRLLAILHSRVVAVLSFPLLAWVLFAAVNWGWHFGTLYDQPLQNQWLPHV